MTTDDGGIDTPDDGISPHDLEAPRPGHELYQAFPNEPVPMGVDPKDGLPVPVIPHSVKLARAPALDPERMVCLQDATEFVVRDKWGDVVAKFAQAERAPDGRYRVTAGAALEANPTWEAAKRTVANGPHGSSTWLAVDPVRPQCKFYRRQYKDFADDPDHKMVIRLCLARKTDEGQPLSMGDSEMFGCELREPSFGNRVELIDEFDDGVIEMGRESKRRHAEFDVEAALNEEGAGIFDGS